MIKNALFIILYIFISIITGTITARSLNKKNKDLFALYLYGALTNMAIYGIINIPVTFLKISLTKTAIIMAGITAVLFFYSIIFNRAYIKKAFKTTLTGSGQTDRFGLMLGISIMLIIAIQIFYAIEYVFLHENDAYYVASVTTSLATDSILRYSPYTGKAINFMDCKYNIFASMPFYLAVLSRISGIDGAVMAHTLIPVLFIILGYSLYMEIARILFKNEKNQKIFMFIISTMNLFMGKTYASGYEGLTTCIWQGGSFLYAVALPFLLLGFLDFTFEKNKKSILIIIMALILCMMSVAKSGIILGMLSIFAMLLAYKIIMVTFMKEKGKYEADNQ